MQRAKAVEGAVGTSTVANMMNRDHMRVFFRRTAALAAFVALLWAVQVVNWITGYGLNPAFGLIPRHVSGLDGVIAMPLLHGSFAHLMANTPPLLVMGGLLVATTTRALLPVNAVVIGLGGGLGGVRRGEAHARFPSQERRVPRRGPSRAIPGASGVRREGTGEGSGRG